MPKVIPAIGDVLIPVRPNKKGMKESGMVVNVLPNGEEVILARYVYKSNEVLETHHFTRDLKGTMTGKVVVGTGSIHDRKSLK